MDNSSKIAVVAGAGEGLGIALCKKLLADGYAVAGLSRTATPQPELGDKYLAISCDLTDQSSVDSAITTVEQQLGSASVYIHNAAYFLMREFLQTSPKDFTDMLDVVLLAAVHGAQRVLPNMLENKNGTILLTGATASIKAGAHFSAFAAAKFALRGLSQSLAREYSPQGIHVAHIIVDGAIWGWQAEKKFGLEKHVCLLPEDIADTYLHLIKQKRSAWTHELDLRPDIETF